jgi:hypothetical protein
MNSSEKKMVKILTDLRQNYFCESIKAEFEAEGTRMEEALRLKEIATSAGVGLTIKIGGCEALKDMYDARTIGVNTLVAPMIESVYALKKFMNAINSVFTEAEREDIKFMINVETITGYHNLDEILDCKEAEDLAGIVLGRYDMTASLDLSREDINSDEILKISENMSKKIQAKNKTFIVGGGVSVASLDFFKKLTYIDKFETRKVIFDANKLLHENFAYQGVLKAIEFELMWLNNKRDFYGTIKDEDKQRFVMLENLYQNHTGK